MHENNQDKTPLQTPAKDVNIDIYDTFLFCASYG